MEDLKIETDRNISEIKKERNKTLILFASIFLVSSFLLGMNIIYKPLSILYPALFSLYVIAVRMAYLRFITTPAIITSFPLITFLVLGLVIGGIFSIMGAEDMGMEGIIFLPGIFAFFFGGLIFSVVYSRYLYKERTKNIVMQKN